MKIPRYYTLAEVAHITRAPQSTVQHWVYTFKLSTVKVGRHRLVPDHSLRAFLQLGDTGASCED
ncbi:MAG: helix-turn-helix domain-containing protein [Halieaceae bacterium]|nr:helix-turn-helix domain-containing protein [Halieaceae bacterium]